MVFDNKYGIGEVVYLQTDIDQKPRIVYAFVVYKNEVLYRVVCGTCTSDHYDFELTKEKDVIITSTN